MLLTWDGERFRYVTDFLGAGAVGEISADGSSRPPRPEESVKIEPGQLVPRDGRYVLKIAEPMDEVLYLDRLRLVAIDHPADVEVHPDERFAAAGPPPTQELLAFRDRLRPDQGDRPPRPGRDRRGPRPRRRRPWTGSPIGRGSAYAEDHSVELDFGDQLAGVAAGRRVSSSSRAGPTTRTRSRSTPRRRPGCR